MDAQTASRAVRGEYRSALELESRSNRDSKVLESAAQVAGYRICDGFWYLSRHRDGGLDPRIRQKGVGVFEDGGDRDESTNCVFDLNDQRSICIWLASYYARTD